MEINIYGAWQIYKIILFSIDILLIFNVMIAEIFSYLKINKIKKMLKS